MVMVFRFRNVERDLDQGIERLSLRGDEIITSVERHLIHPSFERLTRLEECVASSICIGYTPA